MDKELWRRVAPAGEGVLPSVSELDFAAWLDGRLSEAQAAAVEAALAADPALRRAALDLSELLGQPLPAPPPRLAVRAQALLGFDVERRQPRLGLLDWLLGGGRGFIVQRVATLAAAVIVAISGFLLGGGLGESLAEERHVISADAPTLSSSSNDPTEFLGSDGI
jgi:anti-sigma factor RsiW